MKTASDSVDQPPIDEASAAEQMVRLLRIMAQLRHPEGGCPWDLEQDFATIAPYTIEEAYEVADAIARADMPDLCDELGDLLFQAVFHAQMAAEQGSFDFTDVAKAVSDKMVRRHPHVFGDSSVGTADAQSAAWEDQKAAEREDKQARSGRLPSILDDVPVTLPALLRARKLGNRMARAGFDWPDTLAIADKVEEELDELRAELKSGDDRRIAEELGDLLFSVAQIGRRLGIDPEDALRHGNRKVEKRFREVERRVLADGRHLGDLEMDDLETYWRLAKSDE